MGRRCLGVISLASPLIASPPCPPLNTPLFGNSVHVTELGSEGGQTTTTTTTISVLGENRKKEDLNTRGWWMIWHDSPSVFDSNRHCILLPIIEIIALTIRLSSFFAHGGFLYSTTLRSAQGQDEGSTLQGQSWTVVATSCTE